MSLLRDINIVINNDLRPRIRLALDNMTFCLEGEAREALGADTYAALGRAYEALHMALLELDEQQVRSCVQPNREDQTE